MSPAASDHDIDYGVDAPGVIRALLLSGISGLVVALVLVTTINAGWGDWLGRSIALVAAIPTILGLSMGKR